MNKSAPRDRTVEFEGNTVRASGFSARVVQRAATSFHRSLVIFELIGRRLARSSLQGFQPRTLVALLDRIDAMLEYLDLGGLRRLLA